MIARVFIAWVAGIGLLLAACSNGDQPQPRIESTESSGEVADAESTESSGDVADAESTESSGEVADAGPEAGIVEPFIGLEYSERPPAVQFGGVNDYSGPMDPNDPTGYGIARMLFEDTHVYLLQRFVELSSDGKPVYLAVDGIEVVLNDDEGLPGNGIERFWRGEFDPEVIAVADMAGSAPRFPAVRAWRFNRATERVEPIDPTEIECVVLGDH